MSANLKPITLTPSALCDEARRKAYLSGKGIKPSQPHQLDLLFPKTIRERDDLRHLPNDYARSSLFSVRNKTVPRKTMTHEKLFHFNEYITIFYTGIELRADDDEIVWLQILKYSTKVALGDPFEFDIKDLIREVGWSKNGQNYKRTREIISRLKASEVMARNEKAYGYSGAISLINKYLVVNDAKGKPTRYRVWIDPNLILLFAGNTFTSHSWEVYRDLSPVARRLTDYIESHQNPYPLAAKKFQQMCFSNDNNMRSWRQTVKKACAEVQKAKIATLVKLDVNDQICCVCY